MNENKTNKYIKISPIDFDWVCVGVVRFTASNRTTETGTGHFCNVFGVYARWQIKCDPRDTHDVRNKKSVIISIAIFKPKKSN